ncbi:MAG: class I SAM-dependent methyltransferase [Deltaproteobacteria bacterium]|nr:class I SAM-dependent methyltransferase [Deltaproteobacteria bacterium]
MKKKTDWDSYYKNPNKISKITRKITADILIKLIKKYITETPLSVLEFGGANSCTYDFIANSFNLEKYVVIDNNQLGLDKFSERDNLNNVILENDSVLKLSNDFQVDFTYSIGLIEHFSKADTRKAIASHFETTKKNGLVIISFPTPTFLYKICRKILEILGLWIFHDERPLHQSEVLDAMNNYGEILNVKINWPIMLTQCLVVARKL